MMTIMASSIYGIQSNTSPNEYPQQKLSKKGTNALIDHSINWIQRWSPTQVRTFMLCIVNFTWPGNGHCTILQGIAMFCIVLHCIALYCIVLHCIALYCNVLQSIAFFCIWQLEVHCNLSHKCTWQAGLHQIIAMHCIITHGKMYGLHCIILQYII